MQAGRLKVMNEWVGSLVSFVSRMIAVYMHQIKKFVTRLLSSEYRSEKAL
jgi:hypothetical protein